MKGADLLGIGAGKDSIRAKADSLLGTLRQWKEEIGLSWYKLADYNIYADQTEEMVRMTHWVGGGPLTRDRYRLSDEDLAEILNNSLNK